MKSETLDRLFRWLEDDRDRRSLVIRASHLEIWWAALRIDERAISGADDNDLDDLLTKLLTGMVVTTTPAGETEIL